MTDISKGHGESTEESESVDPCDLYDDDFCSLSLTGDLPAESKKIIKQQREAVASQETDTSPGRTEAGATEAEADAADDAATAGADIDTDPLADEGTRRTRDRGPAPVETDPGMDEGVRQVNPTRMSPLLITNPIIIDLKDCVAKIVSMPGKEPDGFHVTLTAKGRKKGEISFVIKRGDMPKELQAKKENIEEDEDKQGALREFFEEHLGETLELKRQNLFADFKGTLNNSATALRGKAASGDAHGRIATPGIINNCAIDVLKDIRVVGADWQGVEFAYWATIDNSLISKTSLKRATANHLKITNKSKIRDCKNSEGVKLNNIWVDSNCDISRNNFSNGMITGELNNCGLRDNLFTNSTVNIEWDPLRFAKKLMSTGVTGFAKALVAHAVLRSKLGSNTHFTFEGWGKYSTVMQTVFRVATWDTTDKAWGRNDPRDVTRMLQNSPYDVEVFTFDPRKGKYDTVGRYTDFDLGDNMPIAFIKDPKGSDNVIKVEFNRDRSISVFPGVEVSAEGTPDERFQLIEGHPLAQQTFYGIDNREGERIIWAFATNGELLSVAEAKGKQVRSNGDDEGIGEKPDDFTDEAGMHALDKDRGYMPGVTMQETAATLNEES